MVAPTAHPLGSVLRDVGFPASRWQLVAAADAYGADARTKADLWVLPEPTYHNFSGVVIAVERARPDGREVG